MKNGELLIVSLTAQEVAAITFALGLMNGAGAPDCMYRSETVSILRKLGVAVADDALGAVRP